MGVGNEIRAAESWVGNLGKRELGFWKIVVGVRVEKSKVCVRLGWGELGFVLGDRAGVRIVKQ